METMKAFFKKNKHVKTSKKMSSPSRLLRGRPTAPLPTQYASNSLNSLHKSDIEQTSPSSSGSKRSSTHSTALCCTSTSVDVSSEEQVKGYLRFHKSFLEEFILEDVSQETLERVLVKKAQWKDSTPGIKVRMARKSWVDVWCRRTIQHLLFSRFGEEKSTWSWKNSI